MLRRSNSARAVETAEAASHTERVYRQIRHDIIVTSLRPDAKLKVLALRDRYAAGATPIREALSRLSSEGLIVQSQQRGFRVAPLSLEELAEISEMRGLLEQAALRKAIAHGDIHWEGEIVSAFHKLEHLELRAAQGQPPEPELWEALNKAFHDALVASAQSSWLLKIRENLYDQHGRYRAFARLRYTGGARAVHLEHRDLMEAAIARDAERACALIVDHIEGTANAIRAAWTAMELDGASKSAPSKRASLGTRAPKD